MFRKFGLKTVISVLTAATVLLAACAGGQSGGSSKEGQITVWYFDKVSMETAIPMFEKAYPGIKVNFVQQPFGDMSKKYLAALAAKSGVPDVIGLDTSMVGRFLDAGENLLDPTYNAEQFRQDFIEWKFNAAVAPNGEMPVFPWDVATGVMFYQPAIFAKAGLPTEPEDVSKELATWEDYIKAGEKIAEATNGESSIVANPHDVFNAAFWQSGGNIVVGNQIAFAKEGQEPLALAVKANDAKISAKVATWSERWAPSIKSGKVATVVMGAWMLGNFQNLIDKDGAGKWRIAKAPGGAFDNGGTYLQVPKLAKNKAAAWEFVKFLTTKSETQNAVFQKTGIVPAYTPAWKSSLYDEPVPYLGGQKAWRLLVELAVQVKPLHYSAVDALGTDLLNAQVDAAIAGKTTPAQALQTAATQLKERAARASNIQLTLPS